MPSAITCRKTTCASFKPEQLVIHEGATMKDEDGKPRRLVAKDIDEYPGARGAQR